MKHEELAPQWQAILNEERQRFLIHPRWRIDLIIRCPNEMPNALGSMSWEYLPNAHYRLYLRCDVDPEMVRWIIAHELLEALMAPYADLMEDQLERVPSERAKRVLHARHADIRNEIIESLLPLILGSMRPV